MASRIDRVKLIAPYQYELIEINLRLIHKISYYNEEDTDLESFYSWVDLVRFQFRLGT